MKLIYLGALFISIFIAHSSAFAEGPCDGIYQAFDGTGTGFTGNYMNELDNTVFKKEAPVATKNEMFNFFRKNCGPSMSIKEFADLTFKAHVLFAAYRAGQNSCHASATGNTGGAQASPE